MSNFFSFVLLDIEEWACKLADCVLVLVSYFVLVKFWCFKWILILISLSVNQFKKTLTSTLGWVLSFFANLLHLGVGTIFDSKWWSCHSLPNKTTTNLLLVLPFRFLTLRNSFLCHDYSILLLWTISEDLIVVATTTKS